MKLDGIYLLEYNEKQRCFHCNCGENIENTFGWVSLRAMSFSECDDFTEFMNKKYVEGRVTGVLPELSVVRLELQLFFELKKHRRKLAGRIL